MVTDFLDKLNERYACKAMNGETVAEEKICGRPRGMKVNYSSKNEVAISSP